ncbi:hypothetical protein ACN47E_007117 [Coniothyrium glycines]
MLYTLRLVISSLSILVSLFTPWPDYVVTFLKHASPTREYLSGSAPAKMTPEQVRAHRDQLAYMHDAKAMILSDARALFSLRGCTSHKATFDVITSTYDCRYQASLIMYPDPSTDLRWTALCDGVVCKDLPTAVRMLWDAVQTALGDAKSMHHRQAAAAVCSPGYKAFEGNVVSAPMSNGCESGTMSQEPWERLTAKEARTVVEEKANTEDEKDEKDENGHN